MVYVNQIHNLPVTRDGIMADEDIFGPNLGYLKGSTKIRTSPVAAVERVAITPGVNEIYVDISLTIDIMFVNKVAFVITV